MPQRVDEKEVSSLEGVVQTALDLKEGSGDSVGTARDRKDGSGDICIPASEAAMLGMVRLRLCQRR